jgi:hypothetical protein
MSKDKNVIAKFVNAKSPYIIANPHFGGVTSLRCFLASRRSLPGSRVVE